MNKRFFFNYWLTVKADSMEFYLFIFIIIVSINGSIVVILPLSYRQFLIKNSSDITTLFTHHHYHRSHLSNLHVLQFAFCMHHLFPLLELPMPYSKTKTPSKSKISISITNVLRCPQKIPCIMIPANGKCMPSSI